MFVAVPHTRPELPIRVSSARLKVMSIHRSLVGVAECVVVLGVAITGCSSSSESSTTAVTSAACAGFQHRYVGGGLTVDLPADVAQVSGESTSDPGPVHASESHDFSVGSSAVTVGRRLGTDVVDEPSVSERVANGVVLFARASNEDLDRAHRNSAGVLIDFPHL